MGNAAVRKGEGLKSLHTEVLHLFLGTAISAAMG